VRALALQLRRVEGERERLARRLEAVGRAANRKLAAMVAEIASLRHHEARVAALERLLAERDAALAAQAERLRHLEATLAETSSLTR
jgi:hypothetical protein